MRIINTDVIAEGIKEAFIRANYHLPADIYTALKESISSEQSLRGKSVLSRLVENADAAVEFDVPICQDTGMATVFLQIGQEVVLEGIPLNEAVNMGVRRAYTEGWLRKSVAADPFRRENTGDNTPAIIYIEIIQGDRIIIDCQPKGAGSENMCALKMFNPSANEVEVIRFITETVEASGGNSCPPLLIGVGIGGSPDYAMVMAKKALLRPVGTPHSDPFYAGMEESALSAVNATGVGPQGFGGDTTAVAVHINAYATHIASLPVAVSLSCHVTRHERVVI